MLRPTTRCGNCDHMLDAHMLAGKSCSRQVNGKRCECTEFKIAITKAEVEVLRLAARGMSVKEIAGLKQRSYKTIEFHLNSMRLKTGVHSTLELVLTALRAGVITMEDLPEIPHTMYIE